MADRSKTYQSLRKKVEEVGFQFDKEQWPHLQNRKEKELVFEHPRLISKFEEDGYKVRAEKFYIKPLSDDPECEIGFVTGITSPIYDLEVFPKPNAVDTHGNKKAWTNRKNEHSLDKLLKAIGSYLAYSKDTYKYYPSTYLIIWNPTKWVWIDLKEDINHLQRVGSLIKSWSCCNLKSIEKGDRVFLISLGEEPKGIIGSGYAKSTSYSAPHWDDTKNKETNYFDMEFDVLIDPEESKIFSIGALQAIDKNHIQQWLPQRSGILVKKEVVNSLEANWLNFINENNYITKSFFSNDDSTGSKKTYKEGKPTEVKQTAYERNPKAREECLQIHGYSCKVCDFNFKERFGEIGEGFIHVHHIKPISEIAKEYEVDPSSELIPVCPNCHAMIHSKRPALTIEKIREIRKDNH